MANLVFAYSCKVLSAHKDFVSVKWLVNKLKWIGRNEHNFLAPFVPQRAIKGKHIARWISTSTFGSFLSDSQPRSSACCFQQISYIRAMMKLPTKLSQFSILGPVCWSERNPAILLLYFSLPFAFSIPVCSNIVPIAPFSQTLGKYWSEVAGAVDRIARRVGSGCWIEYTWNGNRIRAIFLFYEQSRIMYHRESCCWASRIR